MRQILLNTFLSGLLVFAFASLGFAQSVPENMYYTFDGAGSVISDCASSPVGTNPAAIVGTGLTQGGTGQFQSALVGTGAATATDYVNTGWTTSLSGSWTISFWVSGVPQTTALHYLFGDNTAGSFRCFTGGIAGAGNIRLRGGFNEVPVNTGALTATGVVVHLVYDAVAGNITPYINGAAGTPVAQPAITISGSGPFKVGSYGTGLQGLSGSMDEFRIYNRALGAAEVLSTYNATLCSVNLPGYDVAMSGLNMATYNNLSSAPFDIDGDLTNLGDSTITDLELAYSIDGGTAVIDTFTGLNIATFGSYNFNFPTKWNPSATGGYDVKAWVKSINFQPDSNNVNDTVSMLVNVVDTFLQRLPIHESFTSSTCGPCAPGNANLASIWNAQPERQIILKYQMSWPGTGDPYYTAEGNDRRNYYGINSVPRLEVDGQWDGNSNSYTSALRDAFWSVPAFMSIDVDYEVNCKQVDATVTIHPFADWPAGQVLHFAIIEQKTFNNVKSNGETEFDNVMKKMLPDANGTVLPALVKGVPFTTNFTYTFNGNYRLSNSANDPINHATEHSIEEFFDLQVVAFVQDNGTKVVQQSDYGFDIIKQDVATTEVLTPTTLFLNNAPFDIEATFQNWQDSILNTLDYNYSIDNGPVQTMSLSSLAMDIGDDMTQVHSTPWNPSAAGNYDVKVWTSNPNGGMDEVACNDTITITVSVNNAVVAPVADFTWGGSGLSVDFMNTSSEDPVASHTYQWDMGDGSPLQFIEEPSHTYSTAGLYTVCFSVTNTAGSDTKCQSVSVPLSGIAAEIASSVSVFPNPSEGLFHIENQFNEDIVMTVVSPSGEILGEYVIEAGSETDLNLTGYASGLYLAKLKTSRGESVKKLNLK